MSKMTLQEIFKALGEGKTLVSIPDGKHSMCVKDNAFLYGCEKTLFSLLTEYNWQIKKPTININGVELVAPECDAPEIGTTYFVLSLIGVFDEVWQGLPHEHEYLVHGIVFLTKQDAEAMRQALIGLLKGDGETK